MTFRVPLFHVLTQVFGDTSLKICLRGTPSLCPSDGLLLLLRVSGYEDGE